MTPTRLAACVGMVAGLLVFSALPAVGASVTVRAPAQVAQGDALVVSVGSKRPCALVASQGSTKVSVPRAPSRRGKVTFRLSTAGWTAGTWRLAVSCGRDRGAATVALVVDDPPAAPEGGSVEFSPSDLRVSWVDPAPPEDLATYNVQVTRRDNGRAYVMSTPALQAVIPASTLVARLGSGIAEVSVIVSGVDRRGQTGAPLTLTGINAPPPAPVNPTARRALYAYDVSWSAPNSDDVVMTRVLEAPTPEGDSRVVATTTSISATVSTGLDDARRWVRVAHVDAFGLASAHAPQEGMSVKPRGIGVDFDPPEQRTDIAYVPGVETVLATWVNPQDEELNEDLAGVTIRYHRADQPGNYYWKDVSFTFTTPVDSAVIGGLLPNTEYVFQVSAFDQIFNRTPYSEPVTVTTLRRPCFGCPG